MSLIRNVAIATGATVAVAGGALAYVHFKGLPWANGDAAATASAEVIPDDATLALSLSGDKQSWTKLSEYGSPTLQRQVESSFQPWETNLQTASGLSLKEDVLPIVSGVTLALLPPTEVESAGSPEFLVVVGIKNPTQALALLGKLQDGKAEINTFEHQGITVSEFVPSRAEGKSAPESLFSALVNQQLVVAPTRRPVEMAIEASKGDPSLADVPGAAAALRDGLGMNTALARVYVPSYGRLLTQLMAVSPDTPPLSPQVLEQLQDVGSVQMGLGLKADGLHVRTVSEVSSAVRPTHLKPSSGPASSQFPLNTVALVQSRDINQYWDQITQQLAALPNGEQLLGRVRSQVKEADINLETDVFDWMTGEFAFGILPVSDQSMVGQIGFAPALVLDSGDRPTTEATLKKLDRLAGGFLELKQRKAGAVEVTQWVAPASPPEAVVGHGWLDQDSLLIATGQPAINALTQPTSQTLAKNPLYQEVMAQLPAKAQGYGFINVEEILLQAQRSPLTTTVDPRVFFVLERLRGIGVVLSRDKNTSVLEMHIALQRTDNAEKMTNPEKTTR